MFLWGLRPQTPGIYRADANPSESNSQLGLDLHRNPSLVLAPESALSLLPSVGLRWQARQVRNCARQWSAEADRM